MQVFKIILISPDGKLLNNPVGYTPDESEYAAFLSCGTETFKELSAKKEDDPMLGQK